MERTTMRKRIFLKQVFEEKNFNLRKGENWRKKEKERRI